MGRNYDVFLSYSRHDKERVRPWVDRIASGGVRVFFDTESLVGGMEWQAAIVEAIEDAQVVIFMASRHSFSSDYTPKELSIATTRRKVILPVFLDKVEVPTRFAFPLAGVQQVEAFGRSEDQIWKQLLKALAAADVRWKDQAITDSGRSPQRKRTRDDLLEDWEQDPPKIEVEEPRPPPSPARVRPLPKWSTVAFAGAALSTCLIIAFISRQSAKSATTSTSQPATPVISTSYGTAIEKDPSVPLATPVPSTKAQSLSEAAEEVARTYFTMPAAERPGTHLFDETVDYLHHGPRPVSEVRRLLGEDHARWKTQVFKVPGKMAVTGSGDDVLQCRFHVEFHLENNAIRSLGQFECIVSVGFQGSTALITGIKEVAGSRQASEVQFYSEGQRTAAIDFVRRVVLAGNSNPGKSAGEIGAMFTETPLYGEKPTSRDEIIHTTDLYQRNWTTRDHTILGVPTVSGLGTEHVVVRVTVEFEAHHKDGRPMSSGTVISDYGVRFGPDGSTLIESFLEVGRL